MENEIKKRIEVFLYPQTRASAILAEADGDKVGAGLFWGLVSAPRRSAHHLAMGDVEESSHLLGIPIPENISKTPGLQTARKWVAFLEAYQQ
jgi:hypothetical protein